VIPRSTLIVHREAMVAEAIAAALTRYPAFAPITCATTIEAAIAIGSVSNVMAIDHALEGGSEAARHVRRKGTRVVMIGGASDDEGVTVPPSAPISVLAATLVPGVGEPTLSNLDGLLSPREQEVLHLVSRGLEGKRIAKELGISPKTVEQHKTRIYTKLGVPNQTAAACVFVEARQSSRQPLVHPLRFSTA
jgi:DNA-binding NarL/FixJ family response regulator